MKVHISVGHKFGVIGDRRTRNAGNNKDKKKKHSFMVGDQEFELDVKYVPFRLQLLGKGAFGLVCGCHNGETGERVAVKKITEAFATRFKALSTLREIQILKQIHHENVIPIKDVMISSSPAGMTDFRDVYIVQELMDFDLAHVIANISLSEEHCKYLLLQILRGVDFLHSVNVVHRDIKPTNLVLNKDFELKICDFGHARTINENTRNLTYDIGTRAYKAPEVLTGCPLYGKEVDMWSVGCTFAEMLGGGVPIFNGTSNYLGQISEIHRILGTQKLDHSFLERPNWKRYIKGLPYWSGVCFSSLYPKADPLAVDLLEKMLQFDPSKRISAKEALKHPYFSKIYDSSMECSSSSAWSVRLEVDEKPESVNEKIVRELIWKEMLFFHPQEC